MRHLEIGRTEFHKNGIEICYLQQAYCRIKPYVYESESESQFSRLEYVRENYYYVLHILWSQHMLRSLVAHDRLVAEESICAAAWWLAWIRLHPGDDQLHLVCILATFW